MRESELEALKLKAQTDCLAKLELANYYTSKANSLRKKEDKDANYELAAVLYNEAWLEGDLADAAYALGYACYFGLGVDEDKERASALFEAAYARGNIDACNFLGDYYRYHGGNLELAAKYYFEAAERGNEGAIRTLTWVFRYGNMSNLPKNMVLAEEYARKGAAINEKEGQLHLADFLYSVKRYDEAIVHYQRAIAYGNEHANYKLALCYDRGHGVKADVGRAIELYEKCGNLGVSEPIVRLCYIYLERYNGDRLSFWLNSLYQREKDEEEYYYVVNIVEIIQRIIKKEPRIVEPKLIMEILEWAVTLSSALAECVLGDIYYQGIYGVKDEELGVKYYIAALKDYPYEYGDEDYDEETADRREFDIEDRKRIKKFVRLEDKKQAFRNMLGVLKEDDDDDDETPLARERIVEIQRKLSQAEQNFNEYKKLAENGDISAMYTLADFYFTGTGTVKDYTKAAELLLELDRKNTRDLLDDLGLKKAVNLYKRLHLIHKKGIGVKKDSIKAREFKERISAIKKY